MGKGLAVSYKTESHLPYDPAFSPSVFSQEKGKYMFKKDLYEIIHSHLTLNRQKLKTTQVSISRRKDKWITDTKTVVLSHNGVLFSNKKGQMTGT